MILIFRIVLLMSEFLVDQVREAFENKMKVREEQEREECYQSNKQSLHSARNYALCVQGKKLILNR